ncbi:hypothetical protein JAAARDRAFT_102779, partial [Jaapia argillacea MUCL 33604]
TPQHIVFLSGVEAVEYDCCTNSCCCFVGPHADLDECPYCKVSWYNRDGFAKKTFTYLPLIPQLVTLYHNRDMVERMGYQAGEHVHEPGAIRDILDCPVYRSLLGSKISINGREMNSTYFSDPRDIALGLSTDGFAPFHCRKQTC